MLSAPAPSTPRKCALCPDQIGTTERSDKEFCSDACRSLNWQRNNRVPVSAYTVEDFEGRAGGYLHGLSSDLLSLGKRLASSATR
jgi:predicted nucleic acid-binding Zn ribbon protein